MSKKVLGVFAHPDDAAFFAGGTFAKWAVRGWEMYWLVATRGDKGSADPKMTSERLAQIREEEERCCAQVLGVKEVIFLDYLDGELSASLALRRDITRIIRLKRPDIVVTLDPTVYWYGTTRINHPDHRAIGAATLEAVFPAARDRLNFIELERDEGLAPHKALTIYVAGTNEPTTKVDISDFMEIKIASLAEHKSQIADVDELAQRLRERYLDPQSPTEDPRYVEYFRVITLN